jgi:murein DD-endopeptidase MepM/ murein hydrolase activator NlpD
MGRWSGVSRVALVALIGSFASACSSERLQLSENPFNNPFTSSQRLAATDPEPAPQALPATQVAALPTAPVQSQPLPPIGSQPVRAASSSAPVTSSSGGWSAQGGTRITVSANDNINLISNRYGVPANAILQANGLSNAGQVQPGSSLTIPVYNAAGQAAAPTRVASVAPTAPAPSRAVAQAPSRAVAQAPSRVAAQAPAAPQPKFRLVEGPKPAVQATDGTKTRIRPGMTTAAKVEVAKVEPIKKPEPVQTAKATPAPAQPTPQKAPEPVKVASVDPKAVVPQAPAPVAVPAQPQAQPAKAQVQDIDNTASLPKEPSADFRWPARGRVIAGFGANGGNEGINIAVPEGTPVKAAEAGTVTYAGSEVRGYGNLVLIKHDNGYISAYAHNGELNVKRGERVTRGQVVAKSGQTGNVTSPQLHFEIRKGQTPVDPLSYLGGS